MSPNENAAVITVVPAMDASLLQRLRAVAGRARRFILVEGLAWCVGFLLAGATVQFFFDYGTRGMRWSMRAALLGVILVGAMRVFWRRVVSPLRLRFGPADMAKLIERRYPELNSLLISAVRFAQRDVGPVETNSPALMASTIHRAERRVRPLDFQAVLDPRRPRRCAVALLGLLIVSAAGFSASPEMVTIWFMRNVLLQEVDWPKRTTLIVESLQNGELIGARGDDLVIQAHAAGVQPREVEIVFSTTGGATKLRPVASRTSGGQAAQQRGRQTMVTVGSKGSYRYRFTFKNAQADFDFRLEGGDDRTVTYHTRLLERPRVRTAQMRIAPPAYTNRPTITLDNDQRTAQILPGSRVTIAIETNKPITRATLMAGRDVVTDGRPSPSGSFDDQPSAAPTEPKSVGSKSVGRKSVGPKSVGHKSVGPTFQSVKAANRQTVHQATNHYTATLSPTETHTYHFALVDEVGLENRRPVRFALRVVADEPPRARLKLHGAGTMITTAAVLPIELDFADTYGLATVELIYTLSRENRSESSIALPTFRPGATRFETSLNWPVAGESMEPGDVLTLQARATDFNSVTGPGEAQSPEITLRVVTREELLAELARREQEYRADFERVLDAQSRVRGGLLSLLRKFRGEADPQTVMTDLAAFERRQRSITGSVNAIRQQFEQILAELGVNRLDTQDERERLGDRIIVPLNRLAKRDLVAGADAIRRWSREQTADAAVLVDPQQVEILSRMRSVLANMIQWEGYQEIVSMLRDMIRLQRELYSETKDALQEQGSDVFDD